MFKAMEGFTLFRSLLVLALLAGIGAPALSQWLGSAHEPSATQLIEEAAFLPAPDVAYGVPADAKY